MRSNSEFERAYRALEGQMAALAEADGNVFLPNPEPPGPVDYIFICMEPSLGRWARTHDLARAKVADGFRNFIGSIEIAILRFCIQRYLCGPREQYHITDLSKGAMSLNSASIDRFARYDRWYGLLNEEIALVGTPDALIISVGSVVADYLRRRRFEWPFVPIMHYSPLAGRSRQEAVVRNKDLFNQFSGSISLDDLIAAMEDLYKAAHLPPTIVGEARTQLARARLTASHQMLAFTYKLAFERIRAERSTPIGASEDRNTQPE